MKLLYIWVENYKCFKNQGFNFSSKQKFEYDKDNKILKYKENENYIEGLFNNLNDDSSKNTYGVEEITAIVGKNGSGKSTLLDLIINISDILPYYKTEYLIIILDESNEINIISNIEINEIDKSQIRNYKINSNPNPNKGYLDEVNFIYHSNALEYQYYKPNNYMNVYDISTMGLMRDDNKRLQEMYITNFKKSEIVSFFNEEFRRQIEFVYEFDDLDNYIDFKMPNSLSASFSDVYDFKKSIYSRIGNIDKKNTEGYIESIIDKDESINRTLLGNLWKIDHIFNQINIKIKHNSMDSKINLKKFKISLLEGVYFNALDCIIPSTVSINNNKQYVLINQILENKIILNIHNISTIEEFWDLIEKFLQELKIHNSLKFFNDKFYASLKYFRENIEDVFIEKTDYKFNYFRLEVDKNTENNELYKVRNFYNLYKETVFNFNYIQFEWNMSNGENNLLNLFARFYSLIDTKTKDFKHYHNTKSIDELIILMDEADMSFHPEWQRKYIKLIIDFIKTIFLQYKVHLIITTHSPIMLSDIPSDNIIYLSKGVNISDKKDINNRTFAANIYNLYKEEFFFDGKNLNKYFGIIGEFASNKIEYVIKTLDKCEKLDSFTEEEQNEYVTKLNDCKKIINLIGEPLIRNMLENKYQIAEQNLNLKENKESRLGEIINDFDRLSEEDRKKFLKHLIDKYK